MTETHTLSFQLGQSFADFCRCFRVLRLPKCIKCFLISLLTERLTVGAGFSNGQAKELFKGLHNQALHHISHKNVGKKWTIYEKTAVRRPCSCAVYSVFKGK